MLCIPIFRMINNILYKKDKPSYGFNEIGCNVWYIQDVTKRYYGV